jgi:hypothetical protein
MHFLKHGLSMGLAIWLVLLGSYSSALGQTPSVNDSTEAYIRADSSSRETHYYIEVYMKKTLKTGQRFEDIKVSLRDMDRKKLIPSTVTASPEGDSNFRITINESESTILKQQKNYIVFVDRYPSETGDIDSQANVTMDLTARIENNLACVNPFLPVSVTVTRNSAAGYAVRRMEEIKGLLDQPSAASLLAPQIVNSTTGQAEDRHISSVSKIRVNRDAIGIKEMFGCLQVTGSQPAGQYELSIKFIEAAPPELRGQQSKVSLNGGTVPSATAAKRDVQDFLDLGLALTSSVKNQTLPNKTIQRTRTTQGTIDLWFAPILNLKKVKETGRDSGIVQVFTPFYIDAKAATGKITKDTLSLNNINLGSTYEFRDYLNTHAYPDLLRHSLSVVHASDRDFKQDEIKFKYEFQPLFGGVNQPLGSAPDIFNRKPIPNQSDRFGLQIMPVVGVELGRTYRVRDRKEFDGTSRNVRRFYFGGDMIFDLTKYVKLSLSDRFYIRGEMPTSSGRNRNYFLGTFEAPLAGIGNSRLRAAHALVLSFERGDQPPFTNPSVNVFKIGYRIRARGLLF